MDPKNPLETLPEVFVSSTELYRAVSRALKDRSLRQIGPKVYTRNLRDPPELLIKRHMWPVISALVPEALLAAPHVLILAPFLVVTWSVWHLARVLSSERAIDVLSPRLRSST